MNKMNKVIMSEKELIMDLVDSIYLKSKEKLQNEINDKIDDLLKFLFDNFHSIVTSNSNRDSSFDELEKLVIKEIRELIFNANYDLDKIRQAIRKHDDAVKLINDTQEKIEYLKRFI